MKTQYRCFAALTACLVAGAAYGQVTATPNSVTFSSLSDTATIRIADGGTPLPASSVYGARVMVDDSNYSHQFRLTVGQTGEALVTIAPDPVYCEKGSFVLEIPTTRGIARVEVLTPLDELATSVENRASAMGIAPGELERMLTLPKEPLPAYYRVTLPDSVPLGHTFTLPGPADAGTARTWSVNGMLVPGQTDMSLKVVMTQPGPTVIAFQDAKDGKITAAWRGTLYVKSEDAVNATANVRQPVILNGPEGYNQYTWVRDGAVVSTSRQVTAKYDLPGTYELQMTASGPESDAMLSFRSLTYRIEVK